jgi:Transposase DDE domain group 1
VQHDSLALLRQRLYQIVAGYEDANDADRLRHDPLLQIVADEKLGDALGSQPTLGRWENSTCARDLVRLSDTWCQQFIRLCGKQVRQRGEILLDLDSTDDPTYGQQQLSFFHGAYRQHMYHPRLIFERHTGCLLAAGLRPGNASRHARIVPMLLRRVPRLQSASPASRSSCAVTPASLCPCSMSSVSSSRSTMPSAFRRTAPSNDAPNRSSSS